MFNPKIGEDEPILTSAYSSKGLKPTTNEFSYFFWHEIGFVPSGCGVLTNAPRAWTEQSTCDADGGTSVMLRNLPMLGHAMAFSGKPYQNGWFGGTTIFGYIHISPLKIKMVPEHVHHFGRGKIIFQDSKPSFFGVPAVKFLGVVHCFLHIFVGSVSTVLFHSIQICPFGQSTCSSDSSTFHACFMSFCPAAIPGIVLLQLSWKICFTFLHMFALSIYLFFPCLLPSLILPSFSCFPVFPMEFCLF